MKNGHCDGQVKDMAEWLHNPISGPKSLNLDPYREARDELMSLLYNVEMALGCLGPEVTQAMHIGFRAGSPRSFTGSAMGPASSSTKRGCEMHDDGSLTNFEIKCVCIACGFLAGIVLIMSIMTVIKFLAA